jgi:L-amino acid N-acyltransferase YncA
VTIRSATVADATMIATIYAHHVRNGTATFDTIPPTDADWSAKIGPMAEAGHPFLVAEADGQVVGYAYATPFRDRAAYAHTCENSIYIAHGAVGRGIGTALLEALITSAVDRGFREMIAVIGGGEPASIALHTRCGFAYAGRMRNVGQKFGRLLDTVYMQRTLIA